MTITAILVLAVGTYAFRIAGPLLRARITRSPRESPSPDPRVPTSGPASSQLATGARSGNSEVARRGLAGREVGTREEVALPARVTELMSTAATVLLVALVATAALTDGGSFAGVALPVGVLTGGVLAWRKVPFVFVVIVAAGVAAGLRVLGVP